MNDKALALKLCKGTYQRSLVEGHDTLGQSSLHGKAKQYSGKYHQSALSLLSILRENNVKFDIILGPRGGYSSSILCFPDYDEEPQ